MEARTLFVPTPVSYTHLDVYKRQHDGSTIDSVAGRLYILEGMANKHSDQLDEILKDIRQLQNDGAKYDWELKQLQWLHPELKVQPPEANPHPFKSTDLNLDMNPGKVPDVTK